MAGLMLALLGSVPVSNPDFSGNGGARFEESGTHTWVCPSNVTEVSVLAIGGGGSPSVGQQGTSGGAGGGGGGLGYKNTISVTPGASYTVVVGAGGASAATNSQSTTNGNAGGNSYFINTSTVVGYGGGGGSGTTGGSGGSYVGDGGSTGGAGGVGASSGFQSQYSVPGGGGGAAGYSGTGGNGGSGQTNSGGTAGAGGGGGGGCAGVTGSITKAGAGGGTGAYGKGANGAAGANDIYNYGTQQTKNGTGGSGGTPSNTTDYVSAGGLFGGGGGAFTAQGNRGATPTGGGGVVRIIWGTNRAFPSTNTSLAASNGNESLPVIEKGSLTTGILETYYSVGNHYKTSDSGLTWQTNGSTGETYGGVSCGNSFMQVGSPHKYFSSDLSTVVNMGSGSTVRYFKSSAGTLMRFQYNNIQKSTDNGATWTTKHTRSPTGSFSSGFHYGNGVWFHAWVNTSASPRVSHYLVSTDDGETWSSSGITGLPSSTGNSFFGNSTYLNGTHYFISPNNTIYSSSDGLTWSSLGSRSSEHGVSNYGQEKLIWYRDGYFYAVVGLAVKRSTSFLSGWSTFGSNAPVGLKAAAYINGNWIGGGGTSSTLKVYSSSNNCVTWTERLSVTGSGTGDTVTVYGINQHSP